MTAHGYASMLLCMRTTLDLDDHLGLQAKHMAAARRISLRALVEEGLREVLSRQVSEAWQAMDELRGAHAELWKGVGADRYVSKLREGWR